MIATLTINNAVNRCIPRSGDVERTDLTLLDGYAASRRFPVCPP